MTIREKILIVEDEKSIAHFISTILTTNGYETILAKTGTEAMTMLSSHFPDLVILDLGLPDMDGIEVLRSLRGWSSLPVAYGIQIDGVETAGKTGTTSSNTDIWFCGVTPEYSAAVWVGYEHNYRLDGLYGRNAAEIWLKVMEKVHAGDSGLVFDSHPQDFVEETYCMPSSSDWNGTTIPRRRSTTT